MQDSWEIAIFLLSDTENPAGRAPGAMVAVMSVWAPPSVCTCDILCFSARGWISAELGHGSPVRADLHAGVLFMQ